MMNPNYNIGEDLREEFEVVSCELLGWEEEPTQKSYSFASSSTSATNDDDLEAEFTESFEWEHCMS